jgi:hypothetical protein
MESIIEESFIVNGQRYIVKIQQDEIISGVDQKFRIQSICRGENDEELSKISVNVSLNIEEGILDISLDGGEVRSISLDDIGDEDDVDDSGEALNADNLDENPAIEDLLDALPSDLLTCLAKGAATTLVGQLIRCWRKTPDLESIYERVSMIRTCLADHSWHMARKFIFKAGRCIWRLGL